MCHVHLWFEEKNVLHICHHPFSNLHFTCLMEADIFWKLISPASLSKAFSSNDKIAVRLEHNSNITTRGCTFCIVCFFYLNFKLEFKLNIIVTSLIMITMKYLKHEVFNKYYFSNYFVL